MEIAKLAVLGSEGLERLDSQGRVAIETWLHLTEIPIAHRGALHPDSGFEPADPFGPKYSEHGGNQGHHWSHAVHARKPYAPYEVPRHPQTIVCVSQSPLGRQRRPD